MMASVCRRKVHKLHCIMHISCVVMHSTQDSYVRIYMSDPAFAASAFNTLQNQRQISFELCDTQQASLPSRIPAGTQNTICNPKKASTKCE